MCTTILVIGFLQTLLLCTVYANPIKNHLLPDLCGTDTSERILGGQLAKIGEYPWIALLQREGANFSCGGVLINKRYVLTAAHCSGRIPIVNVRLGEHNLETDEDCDFSANHKIRISCADKPIDVAVEKIIRHPEYNPKHLNNTNDITLIRLAEDVKFTRYIWPICLPLPMIELREANVDKKAIVAGWGQTETSSSSAVKLKLEVPIKSNDNCQLSPDVKQICAGGEEGKDACTGDSGGPLMIKRDGEEDSNWFIIGIVSFGRAVCGMKGSASVYTKVADYVQWIVDNIEP